MGEGVLTGARRVAVAGMLLSAACTESGGDGDGPLALLGTSGSNQVAPFTQPLPAPIALRVGRGSSGVEGVEVVFSVSAGTIVPARAVTNDDGIVTATWTLPSGTAPVVLEATAEVAGGPTAEFTAFGVPATHGVIAVTNDQFLPVPRTISAGGTVTWIWYDDAVGHTVTPLGLEPPRSGNPANGPRVYSHTFPTSGNYTFYCETHGTAGGTGMAGVVVVNPP